MLRGDFKFPRSFWRRGDEICREEKKGLFGEELQTVAKGIMEGLAKQQSRMREIK
jgi:hypothetical protein